VLIVFFNIHWLYFICCTLQCSLKLAVCALCAVLSETSGPSTLSENRADSRAETTTSTTQGCAGSSSTGTRITRNGYAWKELTTSSEKEYEQYKHKPSKLKCWSFELCIWSQLNVCYKFYSDIML
jgi:hypothetical protein